MPATQDMISGLKVRVVRLPHAVGLALPRYASHGAAGFDFIAAIEADIVLAPGARAAIPTGLKLALPHGYEMQIRPRSGLALKNGITLPNTPGTIDEDYRGEVKVIIINLGTESFVISRGMRIAQGVIAPVTRLEWQEVSALDETLRGEGGFGSTGAAH